MSGVRDLNRCKEGKQQNTNFEFKECRLHLIQVSCREASLKSKTGQEILQVFKDNLLHAQEQSMPVLWQMSRCIRSLAWLSRELMNSTEWKRKQASLGGQLSTGPRGSTQSGCPEKLQNLCPLGFLRIWVGKALSNLVWTQCWPFFKQEGRLQRFSRSL